MDLLCTQPTFIEHKLYDGTILDIRKMQQIAEKVVTSVVFAV